MSDSDSLGPWFERLVAISRTRIRLLVTILGVAIVLLGSVLLVERMVPELSDPLWIRRQILGFGPWAPVVFIGVQAGQVIIAPIPGQVVAFVGGYLFGVVHGTTYSLIGAAIGSAVVFTLARRYGRPYVERIISEETMTRFDGIVAEDGRVAMFLVFLIPGLPDDVICVLGGITRIPVWQLVGISIVGRVPGYVAVSYAGAGFAAANYAQTAVIVIVVGGLAVIGYRRRDDIIAYLETHRT